jgi:hypothetical protein
MKINDLSNVKNQASHEGFNRSIPLDTSQLDDHSVHRNEGIVENGWRTIFKNRDKEVEIVYVFQISFKRCTSV